MAQAAIDRESGEVCETLKNEVCFVKMLHKCWCEKWSPTKKSGVLEDC
jgi:hypothetical protein